MQNRSELAAAIERAEQRLALARRKQNEVLGDSARHLLSYLTNGACHFPSRLANGACHLSSRTTLSAGRLSPRLASSARHFPSSPTISACDFPSSPAISACHFPSGPADGACRLARSSLCRRHRCSPLLFDVPICKFRVNALLFADFAVAPCKSITFGNLSTRNLSAGPGPLAQPTGSTRCKRAPKNYTPQSSALGND
jgi:hypothetical protein